jgi:hypothetical protein
MAASTPEKDIKSTDPIVPVASIQDVDDITKLPDALHTDIGLELYKESLAMDPTERDAIAKRVKMKLDCILMPVVTIFSLVGTRTS